MAIDTKSHVISGTTYDIQQLGAKLGKKILMRLFRSVAPAFAADEPGDALATFAKSMTDEDLDYLCDAFAKVTMVQPDGGAPDARVLLADRFDTHFAGKYGQMLKWLWAAIDTNFETFFDDLGFNAKQREQLLSGMKAEMLGTPTQKTSSSGASSVRSSAA